MLKTSFIDGVVTEDDICGVKLALLIADGRIRRHQPESAN
jgi:hypothetical protein